MLCSLWSLLAWNIPFHSILLIPSHPQMLYNTCVPPCLSVPCCTVGAGRSQLWCFPLARPQTMLHGKEKTRQEEKGSAGTISILLSSHTRMLQGEIQAGAAQLGSASPRALWPWAQWHRGHSGGFSHEMALRGSSPVMAVSNLVPCQIPCHANPLHLGSFIFQPSQRHQCSSITTRSLLEMALLGWKIPTRGCGMR